MVLPFLLFRVLFRLFDFVVVCLFCCCCFFEIYFVCLGVFLCTRVPQLNNPSLDGDFGFVRLSHFLVIAYRFTFENKPKPYSKKHIQQRYHCGAMVKLLPL